MASSIQIDPARLEQVRSRGLSHGAHRNFEDGMCAMEAAAYVAGEPFSDHPKCVSPVIGAFLRNWNDNLNYEDRNRLITLDLIVRTVGTRSSSKLEERRSLMAADWLVRVHTPTWLRLAKLNAQADLLEGLPEITDMAQVPSIRGPLEAVSKDAAAAGDAVGYAAWAAVGDAAWAAAAWAAAWDAVGDAAWAAAGAAVGDAAGAAAAWAAAWDAAGAAVGDAVGAAVGDAVGAAVGADVGDAAWAALAETKAELQNSAQNLVERMCDLQEAA